MGNALQIEGGLFYSLKVNPLSGRNLFLRLHIMFEGRFVTTTLLVMG